jgi:hypothetical protein
MLDKNKREAFLKDLISVWRLMDKGLNPEQIAIALNMDINKVNILVVNLNETNKIISGTGRTIDFILDQYGLSYGIKLSK